MHLQWKIINLVTPHYLFEDLKCFFIEKSFNVDKCIIRQPRVNFASLEDLCEMFVEN